MKRVPKIAKFIKNRFGTDVMLVGRGISGTIAATTLSDAIGCGMCIVRKKGLETNHSYRAYEATKDFNEYLIVDDFVCEGDTTRIIVNCLADKKCLGFVAISAQWAGDSKKITMMKRKFGIPYFGFDLNFKQIPEPKENKKGELIEY